MAEMEPSVAVETVTTMPEWLVIVILGIVEGITEFLPISSTGHLLLAQQWLPAQSDVFNIVIQSGAVVAVLFVFKQRSMELLTQWRRPEIKDYLIKMFVAFFITAVGGLILKATNFELPENAQPVAIALIVGGILFIWLEAALRGKELSDSVTWNVAILIGVGQLVAAVFPGASRSGTTIVIAMAFGLSRRMAVEFTFLLGVPTLLAAGAVKLLGALKDEGGVQEDFVMLALGTIVSAITAFIAVKWLLGFLQKYTFIAFGWYRILAGILVLMFVSR